MPHQSGGHTNRRSWKADIEEIRLTRSGYLQATVWRMDQNYAFVGWRTESSVAGNGANKEIVAHACIHSVHPVNASGEFSSSVKPYTCTKAKQSPVANSISEVMDIMEGPSEIFNMRQDDTWNNNCQFALAEGLKGSINTSCLSGPPKTKLTRNKFRRNFELHKVPVGGF